MRLDNEAQQEMVVKQWLAWKLQAEIVAGAIGCEIKGKPNVRSEAHQLEGLAETKKSEMHWHWPMMLKRRPPPADSAIDASATTFRSG